VDLEIGVKGVSTIYSIHYNDELISEVILSYRHGTVLDKNYIREFIHYNSKEMDDRTLGSTGLITFIIIAYVLNLDSSKNKLEIGKCDNLIDNRLDKKERKLLYYCGFRSDDSLPLTDEDSLITYTTNIREIIDKLNDRDISFEEFITKRIQWIDTYVNYHSLNERIRKKQRNRNRICVFLYIVFLKQPFFS
jgi:hypothetical protein